MFLNLNQKSINSFAAIDDSGNKITYGELCDFTNEFKRIIQQRTLIFILSENTIAALKAYVACLSNNIVPLLLSSGIDRDLLDTLISKYCPKYLYIPERLQTEFNYEPVYTNSGFVLTRTGLNPPVLNENLSLLLPTSGSTGSPKLVRHSYENIEANARNVAAIFDIKTDDKAIAILPMHYTMGLSVVTSHLFAGATVLLIKSSLTDRNFWNFIKENKATSFTGVPYSYEVLSKLRFFRMDLPHLRIITQGGGKLRTDLFKDLAEYAQKTGKKFIATYGQTEGTARMAYLPAELAMSKTCSIGKAIPEGHLSLIDSTGNEIRETESVGEMVYHGPNVTLGYALDRNDLIKGDENYGVLNTGDIAKRDKDGCYFIIGRKSRFLKLYGLRVSLDEVEQMVKSAYNIECIATGNDDLLKVYITREELCKEVHDLLVIKTGLFHKVIEIQYINEIHKNEAGKPILIS